MYKQIFEHTLLQQKSAIVHVAEYDRGSKKYTSDVITEINAIGDIVDPDLMYKTDISN